MVDAAGGPPPDIYFFSSLPTVVGRKITPLQKGCPYLNSQNLWVHYLTWQTEINISDSLLILR